MSNNVTGNLQVLFDRMENFLSSKTVVGEPITFGDVIIVPLVDVSFGLGAGGSGSDITDSKPKAEGGGGGLGAKITPSAVLVVSGDNVQLVNVKNQDSVNKLIEMAPGFVDKLGFANVFGGDKSSKLSSKPKAKAKKAGEPDDIEEVSPDCDI